MTRLLGRRWRPGFIFVTALCPDCGETMLPTEEFALFACIACYRRAAPYPFSRWSPKRKRRAVSGLGRALVLVGRAASCDYTPRRGKHGRILPPDWIQDFIKWRDGGRCRKCAIDDDLEIHHVQAVIDGGSDHPDNLALLCSRCHAEWTYGDDVYEVLGVAFAAWLDLPPGRLLVMLLHQLPDHFVEVRSAWARLREERLHK